MSGSLVLRNKFINTNTELFYHRQHRALWDQHQGNFADNSDAQMIDHGNILNISSCPIHSYSFYSYPVKMQQTKQTRTHIPSQYSHESATAFSHISADL